MSPENSRKPKVKMETLSGNELIRKNDEAETFNVIIIQNEITKESFT